MASKSRLYGGGDAWSPNGVIPWGYNQETSLAWYADAGVFLSSMYTYEFEDSLSVSGVVVRTGPDGLAIDSLNTSGSMLSLTLDSVVAYVDYDVLPEELTVSGRMNSVEVTTVVQYSNYDVPAEFMQVSGELQSVTTETVVITYNNYPVEDLQVSGALLEVTLA